MATLGMALLERGGEYAATQARAMLWGAVALLVYSIAVCQLLMRPHWNALPATLIALILWLAFALGLHLVVGANA